MSGEDKEDKIDYFELEALYERAKMSDSAGGGAVIQSPSPTLNILGWDIEVTLTPTNEETARAVAGNPKFEMQRQFLQALYQRTLLEGICTVQVSELRNAFLLAVNDSYPNWPDSFIQYKPKE